MNASRTDQITSSGLYCKVHSFLASEVLDLPTKRDSGDAPLHQGTKPCNPATFPAYRQPFLPACPMRPEGLYLGHFGPSTVRYMLTWPLVDTSPVREYFAGSCDSLTIALELRLPPKTFMFVWKQTSELSSIT